MDLFYRKLGSGDPVVILHGLYGSADNWHSIARELASTYSVYLVDQRNHGNSPHHPEHDYNLLSNDLNEFIVKQHLNKPIIIGHSMGGKTALAYGLKYPDRVNKMIVVDISPLGYDNAHDPPGSISHERIIRALMSIDPDLIISREDADNKLKQTIVSATVRQFLLKNLKRTPGGNFRWTLNLSALAENMPAIYASVIPEKNIDPDDFSHFPLLFLKGALSGYIGQKDEEAIRHYFPWAEFIVISGAGHWVHAEQPGAFLKAVHNFLEP
jgi:pimeloyl-ACP methyl ester carboxylesterase